MKRINFLVAMLLPLFFAFIMSFGVSMAEAQSIPAKISKGNIYSVTLNTCTERELVIKFSEPITDRKRLIGEKKDANELTKLLANTIFSKVYGINTHTLVTVANSPGRGIGKAINEIIGIMAEDSDDETNFISAGQIEKVYWSCRSPEMTFLYGGYNPWRN